MKRILLSIGSILFVGALLAGGTGAYLSDMQTSTGNTFASGILELKFDNESYYTNQWGKLALSTTTTWGLSDPVKLAGQKFFNFLDIKPGDIGEDTISLHVNNNNAWACMSIKLTGTPENGQPGPEVLVDPTAGANQGELQNALHFAFWADDGDNVYEKGEKVFVEGTSTNIFNGSWWTLADSGSNIWGEKGGYQCDAHGTWYNSDDKPARPDDSGHSGGGGHKTNDPLLGGGTYYVGKAWCFGTLTAAPLSQDGQGKTGHNGPLDRGTGFLCNGAPLGNEFQSDGITLDVSFNAVQARDNNSFLCSSTTPPPPTSGNQYCSPGYWKQSQHFDNWVGYSPNQQFSSVFDNAFPGLTLLQVLEQGGGGLNALGRATVGELLNAGKVNAPYSQAQVIAMFNAVYPGSSSAYDALQAQFTQAENCPLN